jgi:outer membrane protein OmpA-like peptidoglycan-associated protein
MTIKSLKKPAIIISCLLVLYAIVGFFIIPAVLKAKLPEIIQEQTGRLATVEEINFNPFSLELSLQGFAMKEQDKQQDFVTFKEFYVNTEAVSSLFELALVLDEVRLSYPYVRIEKRKDNSFNFSDLLKAKKQEKSEEESEDEMFPLKIDKIRLVKGHVLWRDAHFDEPVTEPLKPINLSLDGFSTIVDENSNLDVNLDLGSGGHFEWSGKLSVNPLFSNGHLRLAGIQSHSLWKLLIQDKVGFVATQGEKTIEADYNFSFIDNNLVLEVNDAKLDINNFKIAKKGQEKAVIDIPGFSVQGIDFNLAEQSVHIASVTTQDAKLLAWLNSDGTINYKSLFAMVETENTNPPKQPTTKPAGKEKPWQVVVDAINIKNYDLQFEDRTTKKPVHIGLNPIDFTLNDFNIKPGSKLPFQLNVGINKQGKLQLKGTTVLEPFSTTTDLKVNDIALEIFQPYVESFAKLNIIGGKFHSDGNVVVALPKNGSLQLKYTGNSSISAMHTRDTILGKDFVKWRNLNLSNIVFDLEPMRFTVAGVLLDRPYARVTVKKDKTTNLNDIFAAQKSSGKKTKAKKATKKSTTKPYYKITKFKVRKGSSDFSDYSIILPFVAKMNDLNGTVFGISSAKKSTTNVALKGKAYDLAPVEINGKFNPDFSNLDIAMSFTGMPLPLASPYSAEFAGYKIEKGKLTIDLDYKIAQRKLDAQNKLVIDQLTLGEAVDSPKAVSLPLGLAISLLKDANGVINIDLPVTGSLDDPEFSVWGLLWDAFVNLITKIVASPFKALGSLADSDVDFSAVNFDPGVADLGEQEIKKLDELAKALADRPNLKLEVKGTSFTEQDWPAMQEQALLDQLKQIKQKELAEEGEKVKMEDIKLSEDEYNDLLADLFIASFPELGEKSIFGTPKLIGKEDQDFYKVAKNKMASMIEPDKQKLEVLASTRSRNISRHLVQVSKIDISRVFVLDSIVEKSAEADQIACKLSLGVP